MSKENLFNFQNPNGNEELRKKASLRENPPANGLPIENAEFEPVSSADRVSASSDSEEIQQAGGVPIRLDSEECPLVGNFSTHASELRNVQAEKDSSAQLGSENVLSAEAAEISEKKISISEGFDSSGDSSAFASSTSSPSFSRAIGGTSSNSSSDSASDSSSSPSSEAVFYSSGDDSFFEEETVFEEPSFSSAAADSSDLLEGERNADTSQLGETVSFDLGRMKEKTQICEETLRSAAPPSTASNSHFLDEETLPSPVRPSSFWTGNSPSEELWTETSPSESFPSGSSSSGSSSSGKSSSGKSFSNDFPAESLPTEISTVEAGFPTPSSLRELNSETVSENWGLFSMEAEDDEENETAAQETEFLSPEDESGSSKEKVDSSNRILPQEVPGYEFISYLGSGAYGEVWIANQISTNRRVAVKFYTHKKQNIEFLTQEVEKLSLLFSDQNVVQLLEVGWDAQVPYYIMEYMERGSLSEAISRHKYTISEAESMFETLLHALCRAHQKGIIHCDLKPGNILIDQDGNPRLADFGQSRLTNDMAPALGTLFYMPPEQAHWLAQADVRWDIYALGAIFYTMLMGRPPHYAPHLVEKIQVQERLSSRMKAYRKLLQERPVPVDYRQLKGMTLPVAQILEKMLQPNPEERFQSMEELLETWRHCKTRMVKLPLFVLGVLMPVMLVLLGGFFTGWEFQTVFRKSEKVFTEAVLDSGKFSAEAVAKNVEFEISRRRSVVEQIAKNWQFCSVVQESQNDSQWIDYVNRIQTSGMTEGELLQVQTEFSNFPQRLVVQEALEKAIPESFQLAFEDDLMFCDAKGVACARIPFSVLLGNNFRPFLLGNGHVDGMPYIQKNHVSQVFLHPATNLWSVAIMAPVFSTEEEPVFLGAILMVVKIGNFINLRGTEDQFAILVERRPGKSQGVILEHPIYEGLQNLNVEEFAVLQEEKFRVTEEKIPNSREKAENYFDPMRESAFAEGRFQERWLAASARIDLGSGPENGWMVISQISYDKVIENVFASLKKHFWWGFIILLAAALLMIPAAWSFIHRFFSGNSDR